MVYIALAERNMTSFILWLEFNAWRV